MKARHLKVQQTESPYRMRYRRISSKPAITLRGRWLDAAGFPAGSRVTVQVEAGRLIIEPASTEPIASHAAELRARLVEVGCVFVEQEPQ